MTRTVGIFFLLLAGKVFGQCEEYSILYQDEDYQVIVELLANPSSPCEWQFLADSHHKLGNFFEARIAYEEALKISPNNPTLYLHAGICLFSMGEYEASRSKLKDAHGLGLRDKRISYYLGAVDYMEEDFAHALKYLEEVLSGKPDYYDAHYLKGACLFEMGKSSKAEEAFAECIDLRPKDERVQLNLALTLSDQFRFDDARVILDRLASSMEEGLARDAYYHRGVVRYQTHDTSGACEDWGNAAALGDEEAQKLNDTICAGKGRKINPKRKVYVAF